MKLIRWAVGTIIIIAILALIIFRGLPFLSFKELPFFGFYGKAMYIIVLACFMCLFRVWQGPTGADRMLCNYRVIYARMY